MIRFNLQYKKNAVNLHFEKKKEIKLGLRDGRSYEGESRMCKSEIGPLLLPNKKVKHEIVTDWF